MLTRQIRIGVTLFAAFTLILGVAYPLLVTGVAQVLFPHEANGSLIRVAEQTVGSELIGQNFTDPGYFFGRPSATTPPYNAAASGGSNQGPLHPGLQSAVEQRVRALRQADPGNHRPVPIDLVTASGSGLDPDISVASAIFQIPRVARLRGIPEDSLSSLVRAYTRSRQLGLLGEEQVNVLLLNLALDGITIGKER